MNSKTNIQDLKTDIPQLISSLNTNDTDYDEQRSSLSSYKSTITNSLISSITSVDESMTKKQSCKICTKNGKCRPWSKGIGKSISSSVGRRLSYISSLYDADGKGYLNSSEQMARQMDADNKGSIKRQDIVSLIDERKSLKRRQIVLTLGNIIQWLPVIVGTVYTFLKFTERQYQQNVGGRILTSMDYLAAKVVTQKEIDGLWNLASNQHYNLTLEQREMYDRDGFVVLPNFLTEEEASSLEKVVTHNLDEMAFPDILTKCSRKFHGEHYHSSVTWRFWQQPRVSNMLSDLALEGEVPYMVTSEILEMPSDAPCIPQWHWDFLTFPQTYDASYTTGTQIWWSNELVDGNMGGGLAFMPGSHKWANEVDEGAALHECFAMNLFEGLSPKCTQLLNSQMVVPRLSPRDIVVFSRFTLHRSVSRNPSVPFKTGGRKGYTLRIGSSKSIFKKDTMSCFPSHPSSNFQGQLKEGKRYDSILNENNGLPRDDAIYRPMNVRDSEELIIHQDNARRMSTSTFLHYSAQSIFRQKIKWKLAKTIEDTVNGFTGKKTVDISCKANPTPDVMATR